MSMFLMRGTVQNVFNKPESKDRETGEIRPASLNVQLLGFNVTKEGERKLDLQTIKCQSQEAAAAFKGLVGKEALVPVGVFVSPDGQLRTYSLKDEPMPIPATKSGSAA